MEDSQRKRQIKRFLLRLAFLILILLIPFILKGVWDSYGDFSDIKQETERLGNEVEELRQRNEDLKTEVEHLQTERGLEEEVRSRFNVAKEGENLIIIMEEDNNELESLDIEQDGFWQRVKDFLIFW